MTGARQALREQIAGRAGGRWEYCRMPARARPVSFHVEHVISRSHGGLSVLENLAYSCAACNWHKGTNLAGIDPQTGDVVGLFNPRQQVWQEHFNLEGARIEGLTATGRATIDALKMNTKLRVEQRQLVIDTGRW